MSRTTRATPKRHVNRGALKSDARAGRRAGDRAMLDDLRTGRVDLEEADGWTRNAEVSDRWRHD